MDFECFNFKIRTLIFVKVCNRVLTEPNGIIWSPNYPAQYPNDMDCLIQIQLDSRKIYKKIDFDYSSKY